MTIKDAVKQALDDWASNKGFDINDAQINAESLLQEAFDDWAEEHGYRFDEEQCLFVKETKQ